MTADPAATPVATAPRTGAPSGRAALADGWRELATSWFGRALLVVVLLAGIVRLVGVEGGGRCVLAGSAKEVSAALAEGHCYSYNDAVVYRSDAMLNTQGHWFQTLGTGGSTPQATALHAPLFPLLVTPLVWVGIHGFVGLERVFALLGCLTVAAIGLLVRRLVGPTAGLLAAVIAAVHPLVWINDVVMMPEGVYALVVVGVIWLAYRFHDQPSWRHAAALGAGLGVTTLTRNEAAFALVLTGLPLALGARGLDLRARLGRFAVMAALLAIVLAPWVAFNAYRFGSPIFTNGAGSGMSIGTCDDTFYDSHLIGLRSVDCLHAASTPVVRPGQNAEVVTDRAYRSRALTYDEHHLGRVPVVVAARVGRFWSVFRPMQTVRLDDVIEQRGITRSEVGVVIGWLLAPFAVYGAVLLRRRRTPLSPLLAWLGCATIVAASNTPLLRFRGTADLCIVALAAVGLAELWERAGGPGILHGRRPGGAPVADEPPVQVGTEAAP